MSRYAAKAPLLVNFVPPRSLISVRSLMNCCKLSLHVQTISLPIKAAYVSPHLKVLPKDSR
nr:MAG TPA: hypothetical protein [Caudoviricetes sp.]